MEHERVILGIDPGLATVGYGFLRCSDGQMEILDMGVIETPSGMEEAERLLMIQYDLSELILRYRPQESFVEELFFSANVKTALSVSQARGVILVTLASHGLSPRSLKPNEIKLAVTGDGRADKLQVQEMIKRQFRLTEIPRPDDAADALAVAWCGGLASLRGFE
ncbi:MAG: crossover junction endodeoxyribonuclease RuvC [bacterium]|nr:crossover junction endodeoxyribonuclease RuvC [bacterium]